jgi:hypothetical protein
MQALSELVMQFCMLVFCKLGGEWIKDKRKKKKTTKKTQKTKPSPQLSSKAAGSHGTGAFRPVL